MLYNDLSERLVERILVDPKSEKPRTEVLSWGTNLKGGELRGPFP